MSARATDLEIVKQHSTGAKDRARIELRVVRKLLAVFLTEGWKVTVDAERGYDGDGRLLASSDVEEIVRNAFQYDDCHLFFHRPQQTKFLSGGRIDCVGWVRLVFGNDGWDVISDYSTNLEEKLKPINEWVDAKL